uniref:Uncharacterized protein AlNc14C202G8716 n=1 Tax=Albugo laibachii Nc14 TaxID=890382 RepID=F0WQQ6_9STRA|nr:hypothetical protein ALNC14_098090 [Albugo laibachii Nc14]CCA25326.1 hypothetical protein ALNC14_114700 [Albugo laibachii Nc14]|eukprot:CCA25326.1 hypothetical protein ALNC14_114700 [Albugo laibachii Nc14]
MKIREKELQRFGVQHSGQMVLRLRRSLYGLKQAKLLWGQLLHSKLLRASFIQCVTDSWLYYKGYKGGKNVVGVYVDDLLATGTSHGRVNEIFVISASLEIKDMGVVIKFLGMRITHSPATIYEIDESAMIDDLLSKFGLQDAHSVTPPIGLDHEKDTREVDPLLPIENVFGEASLKDFQSRCTRSDIAYAVHRASRRAHAPTTSDLQLSKRIARYSKGTKDVKVQLIPRNAQHNNTVQLTSASDAEFAGDKVSRKSVSGAIFRWEGMIVGWTCSKQASVSLSTREAEFTSASLAGQELLGLRELLTELTF